MPSHDSGNNPFPSPSLSETRLAKSHHASQANQGLITLHKIHLISNQIGTLSNNPTKENCEEILWSLRKLSQELIKSRAFNMRPAEDLDGLADLFARTSKHFREAKSLELHKRMATLIHCLDQEMQERMLRKIASIETGNSPLDSSTEINHLARYLNLPDKFLAICDKSRDINFSHINESRPRYHPEDITENIRNCILHEDSTKQCRLMLANLRRVEPSPTRKDLRQPDDNELQELLECQCKILIDTQATQDERNKAFAKLCLSAKFFINSERSIALLKTIRPALHLISDEAELVFLSSAGLNHAVASRLKLISGSDLIEFINLSVYRDLSSHFKCLIANRIQSLNISTKASVESIAVVIATTDDRRNEQLLICSLASAMLQSVSPKEIYIFIDPVKNDLEYSDHLKTFLQHNSLARYFNNTSILKRLESIKIAITVNHNVKGQYFARNKAAHLTNCDFLAIQDDDDISSFDRFKTQINSIQLGALAVYGSHLRISNEGNYQHDSREFLFKGDGIATLFVYAETIRRNPFLEVRSRADVEFRNRIKISYGHKSVIFLPDILMLMRGSSQTVSSNFEISFKDAFDHFYEEIANHAFC
jgi:hypothetical protein